LHVDARCGLAPNLTAALRRTCDFQRQILDRSINAIEARFFSVLGSVNIHAIISNLKTVVTPYAQLGLCYFSLFR